MSQLQSPRFRPLPPGRVRPTGWLARQLRIQADGISGHLDEFWPDVQHSRWFGGDAEAWERAPYWLDGLVPLAFTLDDEILKHKAMRYMDYITAHQDDDGWLGPRTMIAAAGHPEIPHYDVWAQFLMDKVLAQYHQATGDERALDALEKNLHMLDRHIDRAPLFNWAQFRWFEALIGLDYLYERRPAPWLLDLAVKLHAQGFDWRAFFARWPLIEPTPQGRWNYMGHVVNNAMAIKAHGLWWRHSADMGDRAAVSDMIAKLDRYHSCVTGVFSGDECLAGRSPTRGTELCAVVEYAYSLEILLSLWGEPAWGDRLEQIVFNALPATFSPDMWAHQYDQQVNQIECSALENRTWNTNGPASNLFGVEPNYGCCTANLSQGWPKFAAHLWMETADRPGLAALAYAPSVAHLDIGSAPVTAALETDYPFRDRLHFTVTVERPTTFPLYLRIPAWARAAEIRLAGEIIHPQAGTLHRLDRQWAGRTEIELTLPMSPELRRGYRDAISIQRGPLVYSLPIGQEWRRIQTGADYGAWNGIEPGPADWEVYPTTPWNYALQVSADTLEQDIAWREHPIDDTPFSAAGAPVSAMVYGRRLPEWAAVNGSAADVPPGPVTSVEPPEALTLIPFGCAHLRITEFPQLAGSA